MTIYREPVPPEESSGPKIYTWQVWGPPPHASCPCPFCMTLTSKRWTFPDGRDLAIGLYRSDTRNFDWRKLILADGEDDALLAKIDAIAKPHIVWACVRCKALFATTMVQKVKDPSRVKLGPGGGFILGGIVVEVLRIWFGL